MGIAFFPGAQVFRCQIDPRYFKYVKHDYLGASGIYGGTSCPYRMLATKRSSRKLKWKGT